MSNCEESGIIGGLAGSIGCLQSVEVIKEILNIGESLSGKLCIINLLNGSLSGTYEATTYRISGDLTIADGDTAYLNAGTQFLFDGQYNFNIYAYGPWNAVALNEEMDLSLLTSK